MKGSNKPYHNEPMAHQVRYAFIGMCTKCCLTFINIFLGLLGMIVILAGGYGLYLSTVVGNRMRFELELVYLLGTNISGAMVPLGTALVVVAVAGCIGACYENMALLKLYMWVLGVFLIIEICVVVASFLLVWKTGEMLQTSLPGVLVEDYRPSSHSVLDALQSQMECCGLSSRGYLDYDRNPLYNCYDTNQSAQKCSVPGSCCRPKAKRPSILLSMISNDSYSCAQGALTLERPGANEVVYTEGCVAVVTSVTRTLLYAIISTVILCALIKMYVVYQVRTLLTQIAMLPYNIY